MRVPRVLDWMFLPTRVSRAVEVQPTAVEVETFGGVRVDVGLVGAGQVGGRLLFALIPPVARLPNIAGSAAVALLAALPGQCRSWSPPVSSPVPSGAVIPCCRPPSSLTGGEQQALAHFKEFHGTAHRGHSSGPGRRSGHRSRLRARGTGKLPDAMGAERTALSLDPAINEETDFPPILLQRNLETPAWEAGRDVVLPGAERRRCQSPQPLGGQHGCIVARCRR